MTREEAIRLLDINREHLKNINIIGFEDDIEALDMAINALSSIEQIRWERDIAIEQLKELGYSLGEKIRTSEDCISRQAVVDMTGLSEWFDSSDSYNEFVFALNNLPSVQPKSKEKPLYKIDSKGHIERLDNAVPMSVIEDIKAELNNRLMSGGILAYAKCIDIIDKHIAESEGKE